VDTLDIKLRIVGIVTRIQAMHVGPNKLQYLQTIHVHV
jgi:hypothetical protein